MAPGRQAKLSRCLRPARGSASRAGHREGDARPRGGATHLRRQCKPTFSADLDGAWVVVRRLTTKRTVRCERGGTLSILSTPSTSRQRFGILSGVVGAMASPAISTRVRAGLTALLRERSTRAASRIGRWLWQARAALTAGGAWGRGRGHPRLLQALTSCTEKTARSRAREKKHLTSLRSPRERGGGCVADSRRNSGLKGHVRSSGRAGRSAMSRARRLPGCAPQSRLYDARRRPQSCVRARASALSRQARGRTRDAEAIQPGDSRGAPRPARRQAQGAATRLSGLAAKKRSRQHAGFYGRRAWISSAIAATGLAGIRSPTAASPGFGVGARARAIARRSRSSSRTGHVSGADGIGRSAASAASDRSDGRVDAGGGNVELPCGAAVWRAPDQRPAKRAVDTGGAARS